MLVIRLSGKMGSGKTMAAETLHQHHLRHIVGKKVVYRDKLPMLTKEEFLAQVQGASVLVLDGCDTPSEWNIDFNRLS